MYLLIETSAGLSPFSCGAKVLGQFYAELIAKNALLLEARRWGNDGLVLCDNGKWEPGYRSGSVAEMSDEYWSENNTVAWRGMSGNNWTKLEIFRTGRYDWERVY